MRKCLIAWAALFVATLGGWYLIGMLELGVVDGTGVAPIWLRAAFAAELLLLLPLGRVVLALDPAIGAFALDAFFLLSLVVALNSALLVGVVCLVLRRARRRLGARAAVSRSEE
jgi:hypothetical protein